MLSQNAVCTLTNHGFKDGQQITLSGGSYNIDSVAVSSDTIVTVKNTTANTFEIFNEAGTAGVNVTSFSSGLLLHIQLLL